MHKLAYKYLLLNRDKVQIIFDGELKIEPTPIRPWGSSRSKSQEWLYLVGQSSIGVWVIHEEST